MTRREPTSYETLQAAAFEFTKRVTQRRAAELAARKHELWKEGSAENFAEAAKQATTAEHDAAKRLLDAARAIETSRTKRGGSAA